MNKKGAIEFSMTTIMVIIIGVAVLALGLTWVRGTFRQISDITDTAFEEAKAQLSGRASAENPLVVSKSDLGLKPGEQTVIAVGYLNAVSPPAPINNVKLELSGITKSDITQDTAAKTILTGEVRNWKIVLKAKDTASGSEVGEIKVSVQNTEKRSVPISVTYI